MKTVFFITMLVACSEEGQQLPFERSGSDRLGRSNAPRSSVGARVRVHALQANPKRASGSDAGPKANNPRKEPAVRGEDWGDWGVTVRAVAVSDDGKRALVGYRNLDPKGNVFGKLWDVETGKAICALEGHRATVLHVAFLPDGKRALSVGNDGRLNFYDAATGKLLRSITAHDAYLGGFSSDGTGGFALSPDGKWALTQGADAQDVPALMKVWNLDTGQMVRCLGLAEAAPFLAISPGAKYGVFADANFRREGQEGEIRLRDLESGELLHTFKEKEGWWRGPVGFSRDGRYAILWKKKEAPWLPSHVVFWDLSGKKVAREFRTLVDLPRHSYPPVFFERGAEIITPLIATDRKTFSESLEFFCWDIDLGGKRRLISIQPANRHPVKEYVSVGAFALSNSGHKVILYSMGQLQLWNLETAEIITSWHDYTHPQETLSAIEPAGTSPPQGAPWLSDLAAKLLAAAAAIVLGALLFLFYWLKLRRHRSGPGGAN